MEMIPFIGELPTKKVIFHSLFLECLLGRGNHLISGQMVSMNGPRKEQEAEENYTIDMQTSFHLAQTGEVVLKCFEIQEIATGPFRNGAHRPQEILK